MKILATLVLFALLAACQGDLSGTPAVCTAEEFVFSCSEDEDDENRLVCRVGFEMPECEFE